jgi:hypothetical protein
MEFSDEVKVSLVIGSCLLALVVILKNVLLVPAEILSRDVPFYIIIYGAFSVVHSGKGKANRSKLDRPLYWSLLIILVTLAIIALYAL